MYHNELCNFPTEHLHKKECNQSCECWVTCTRKNSYEWEIYLQGLKKGKPTNNAQKQRELMDREAYRHEAHRQELLDEIEKVNKILNHIEEEQKNGKN